MLFNSFTFLVFFSVVLVCYYIAPHAYRWPLLLVASIIFYMAWNPFLIVLVIIPSWVNFVAAQRITRSIRASKRRYWLKVGLFFSFGLLFVFKYLMLFTNTIMFLLEAVGWEASWLDINVVLPMGISFYTFQLTGYTVDVYRGHIKSERNFFKLLLFVTFFPQLVAGPIERTERLMPQLFSYKRWSWENFITGAKFMAFGFFKKIVIADRIALAVDTVYAAPKNFEGFHFIVATVLFAFQIYCDFSGYSDIAIGSAKMLGVHLMQNFRQPYLSKSIREFWGRWHVSLSEWFKDYVYIPLGGNRCSKWRGAFNVMFTFLVSGIWHGANWTFVIWGALHGFYQVVENLLSPKPKRKRRYKRRDYFPIGLFKSVVTFFLVCFAWVFFRANSVQDPFYIIANLNYGLYQVSDMQYVYDVLNSLGLQLAELLVAFVAILFLLVTEICCGERCVHESLMATFLPLRFAFYFIVLFFIMSMGVFYDAGEFIYFQF